MPFIRSIDCFVLWIRCITSISTGAVTGVCKVVDVFEELGIVVKAFGKLYLSVKLGVIVTIGIFLLLTCLSPSNF